MTRRRCVWFDAAQFYVVVSSPRKPVLIGEFVLARARMGARCGYSCRSALIGLMRDA